MMLQRITLDKSIVSKVHQLKYSLEVKNIISCSVSLPSNLLENYVKINMIKCYCTNDAWDAIETVIASKHEMPNWNCSTCNNNIGNKKSILCDSCLNWYDSDCASTLNKKLHFYN